jgi:hypothetical protein
MAAIPDRRLFFYTAENIMEARIISDSFMDEGISKEETQEEFLEEEVGGDTGHGSLDRIGMEIAGFCFYLWSFYHFFHSPHTIGFDDTSYAIATLQFLMLVIALPLLYIFRIADFFEWGEGLADFISSAIGSDDAATEYFQVKLFQRFIYAILLVLILIDTVETIHALLVK